MYPCTDCPPKSHWASRYDPFPVGNRFRLLAWWVSRAEEYVGGPTGILRWQWKWWKNQKFTFCFLFKNTSHDARAKFRGVLRPQKCSQLVFRILFRVSGGGGAAHVSKHLKTSLYSSSITGSIFDQKIQKSNFVFLNHFRCFLLSSPHHITYFTVRHDYREPSVTRNLIEKAM